MATVAKPIQAKTLVKEANRSRGMASRGTWRVSLRLTAMSARISAAARPATPRAKSGGHSRSSTFIAGQLRAQPTTVTPRQRIPTHLALFMERSWIAGLAEVGLLLAHCAGFSTRFVSRASRGRHSCGGHAGGPAGGRAEA